LVDTPVLLFGELARVREAQMNTIELRGSWMGERVAR
jgi:hypothetical protein